MYILKSETSGKFYIGQSNNLEDRLYRHNTNQNKSTKNRGPWQLIYQKEFETRAGAVALERKLKSRKNPKKVMEWIED